MKATFACLATVLAVGIAISSWVHADEVKSLPCTWEKLADPPKDVAGRECSPGMDGAWVYVPQWKGFLLYGGCSPTYSNEGWFFDPDKKLWTMLWAHDHLAYDKAKNQWQV